MSQHHVLLAMMGLGALVAVAAIALYLWRVRREGRWLPKGPLQWAYSLVLGCVAFLGVSIVVQVLEGRRRFEDTLSGFEARLNQEAPPLSFLALDGKTHRLEDFRGQVVLVNLWATWCPPCVAELPALSRVQTELGDRGVKVVGVSDETPEVVQSFARKRGASHLLGTADLQAAGEPWSLVRNQRPITVLVDRQGRIRDYFVGVRDEAFFRGAAEKLLEQ